MRLLLSTYLTHALHSVETATNGAEALALFKERDYDLVLMDMQMPVMDGYHATAAIRDWERQKGRTPVPVVALTACVKRSESLKALQAGCSSHLAKPLKKAALLRAVTTYAQ